MKKRSIHLHLAASLKRLIIFVGTLVLIVVVYSFILPGELKTGAVTFFLISGWLFSAYFVLPRVHRLLSRMYVPDYFIGRSRTIDGLLGDPINLAVLGSEQELQRAMRRAGWVEADPITIESTWRIIWSTLRGIDYPNAPVSDLYVFDKKQDLAFQRQVDGNPRKRHHVRFWKTSPDWYLPGGHLADWVGAATYDSAIGISMFTLQFTHKIDPNIDEERDFLISTMSGTKALKSIKRIDHFFPPFITRNGGGDKFTTDGSMVIVSLEDRKR